MQEPERHAPQQHAFHHTTLLAPDHHEVAGRRRDNLTSDGAVSPTITSVRADVGPNARRAVASRRLWAALFKVARCRDSSAAPQPERSIACSKGNGRSTT